MMEPRRPRALAGLDIESLPSPVAGPLAAYVAAIGPLARLPCMYNAFEGYLRLIAVIGLGEALQSRQGLPVELREDVRSYAEPTLDRWYWIARAAARHMPEPATVAPEIHDFLTRAVQPLLEGTTGDSFHELRRDLDRDDGLTPAEADRLLALYAPRVEETMRVGGAWLGDLQLVVPAGHGGRPAAGVLEGTPTQSLRPFRPASATVAQKVEAAARAGDAVVAVRGEAVVPLWPLVGRQGQRLLLTASALHEVVQTGPQATVGGFLRLFEQPTVGLASSAGAGTTTKQTTAPWKPPVAAGEHARGMPDERQSVLHRFYVGGCSGYLTVSMCETGEPNEIFIAVGKVGGPINGLLDSFAAAVSMALQHGVSLHVLVDRFAHTRFGPSGFSRHPQIGYATSILDYIFRWLSLKFPDGRFAHASRDPVPLGAGVCDITCPECGWGMDHVDSPGGIYLCRNCGASIGS